VRKPRQLYPNVGNPIGSRRSSRKYGFCIASVRFRYFGVRREGPLSFFVGVGLGSKAPSENLRDRTLAVAVLIILIREAPAAAVADKPRFPANWRTAA